MRKRIATAALAATLLAVPAVTNAESKNRAPGYERAVNAALDSKKAWKPYEKRYLRLYVRFADEFGVEAAGRNIVLFGLNTADGAEDAPKAEVVRDIEQMRAALNPPAVEETTTPAEPVSYETTGAPTSVVECESGGDYGAVNPAGYYGAYQFDQQTWNAYAPDGYAGTNPASAPPAVQDAAAANVPYDAWPNC